VLYLRVVVFFTAKKSEEKKYSYIKETKKNLIKVAIFIVYIL
jgi:hypothetical protein